MMSVDGRHNHHDDGHQQPPTTTGDDDRQADNFLLPFRVANSLEASRKLALF